jgi:hypothetical protein
MEIYKLKNTKYSYKLIIEWDIRKQLKGRSVIVECEHGNRFQVGWSVVYLTTIFSVTRLHSRLGGVVVSVLVTGRCGFELGQDDEFLRTIKIRSTPSSRMGSKTGGAIS